MPRLRDVRCFWRLDPRHLKPSELPRAATIGGASQHGSPVDPRQLPHIDLIVAGSVAVNRKGARVGKGGGYSDLEYALGREAGCVDGETVVATTVHALQVFDEDLPVTAHDFFLDLIVTPGETIRPRRRRRRQPRGILPDHLTAEIRESVPILASLGL